MLNLRFSKFEFECGTDEAGRGCLAGPVTAAAVILTKDFNLELLNDSKKLSEKTREKLKPFIEELSLSFAVTHLGPNIIDEINILNASIRAMQESILKLKPTPNYIIVDGNRFKPVENIPHSTIIKGDSKFMSIAAASVLAKTHRDEFMLNLHEKHPHYKWDRNMGYPTKAHRAAISEFGACEYHRMTFALLPRSLQIEAL